MFAYPPDPPVEIYMPPIIQINKQDKQYDDVYEEYGVKFDLQENTQHTYKSESKAQDPFEQAENLNEYNNQFADIGESIGEPYKRKRELDYARELEMFEKRNPKTEQHPPSPKPVQGISENSKDPPEKSLDELRQEKNSIDKELRASQKSYNSGMNKAKDLDQRADRAELIMNEQDPRKRANMSKYYEKEYGEKPANNTEDIKKMREESAQIKEELKPQAGEIQALKQAQSDKQKQLEKMEKELTKEQALSISRKY